ncbi:MAG: 4Fe-4S dicluster domain-containing protein [Candidatus Eisenbacteria bacterium]|nr:4Fe-4S dicluster domain-containing protein [Candidatus Eisenbacteria bacterium]
MAVTGPGRELEARRALAEKCRSCGTCRSVCPIFAEVGDECSVARGKVALVRAVLDGQLELSEIFDERLQRCLNCKACVDACPNEVRVDDLVLAARSGLVEAGRLPFLKRFVFRQVLRRGGILPPFTRLASFVQRALLRGLPRDSAFRLLLPLAGIDRDRVLPEFADRTFLETMPGVVPAAGPLPAAPLVETPRTGAARRAKRVGYFVGCATNLIYTETGRVIVETLAASGVDVVIPKRQVCCGTPVFNAGDFETARELARKNIELFRDLDVDAVITGCASGGLAFKREYEELLGFEGGFPHPVFDFTEFLACRGLPKGLRRDDAAGPAGPGADGSRLRVTYHDPCHLNRGQGVSEEPRAVLRALPGVEFVEMADADRCCGGGGTFCLTEYDLAKAIAEPKMDAIRAADVDVVATECPVCIMQLRDMVEQAGLEVEVLGVADVVAMGFSGTDPAVVSGAGSQATRTGGSR